MSVVTSSQLLSVRDSSRIGEVPERRYMRCPWGDINWFRDQYVREGDACSLRANPDPATNLGTDIANFGGQEETSFEGKYNVGIRKSA